MSAIYGEYFKLVYTDWYIQDGQRKPFGNGIHPIVREFIQDSIKRKLNIDYYKILQYETEHKAIKFDHSELINFFVRNFKNNIISLNQIENDDFIYIYPLEIKTTLAPLIEENTIELNGEKYLWYLISVPDIFIIINSLKKKYEKANSGEIYKYSKSNLQGLNLYESNDSIYIEPSKNFNKYNSRSII